jgi:pimeloyl-ACP methyl ester carboxylesterase
MNKAAKLLAGVAGILACVLIGVVAATWAPDRPVSELQARWAQTPSVFVDVAGMQVHLRDEGPRDDPSPIVLLHGTSASLHTWDGWSNVLKSQRRIIRFDLPGFGLTGPMPDGNYTIENYVRVVTAVLDRSGVQRCVLGGNSFGGQVAWETASAQPARVDKLILVDAAGYPLQPTSIPIGFRVARIPVLNRLMEFTLPRALVDSSVRNVYGNPALVTQELVDRYYEITLREGNRAALAERMKQAPSTGLRANHIAALKLPTLILWGRRDRLIPPDNAERFRDDIAGSQMIVFDDLGHVPQEEDPIRTVNAVRQFLNLK